MSDARSAREESGVPSLFLAVGALVWRDPGTPGTERMAPLALIPTTLEREGVSNRFRLRASPEDVVENLSLREKLSRGFRITLPDFTGETPADWAARMQAATGGREGWRVEADALALGIFAFAKFLMWRDLDRWRIPGLLTHPTVLRLLDPAPPAAEPPPSPMTRMWMRRFQSRSWIMWWRWMAARPWPPRRCGAAIPGDPGARPARARARPS
jgi:hypothetical protein